MDSLNESIRDREVLLDLAILAVAQQYCSAASKIRMLE
jgi:hypothetical protein